MPFSLDEFDGAFSQNLFQNASVQVDEFNVRPANLTNLESSPPNLRLMRDVMHSNDRFSASHTQHIMVSLDERNFVPVMGKLDEGPLQVKEAMSDLTNGEDFSQILQPCTVEHGKAQLRYADHVLLDTHLRGENFLSGSKDDELVLRQTLDHLFETRNSLRARIDSTCILSSSWRRFFVRQSNSARYVCKWMNSPIAAIVKGLHISLHDSRSGKSSETLVKVDNQTEYPSNLRKDVFFANLFELNSLDVHQIADIGPCSVDLSGYGEDSHVQDDLIASYDTISKKLKRGDYPRAVELKRQRTTQEERRTSRESKRGEKLVRHLQDRVNRARHREVERWGRLLRRAAELDVTRCCNDVRTLLYARWLCEEASISVGNPPSATGDNFSCPNLTLVPEPEVLGVTGYDFIARLFANCCGERNSSQRHTTHELCSLLHALGPILQAQLSYVPNSGELNSAIETVDNSNGDSTLRQKHVSAVCLLQHVAKALVQSMMHRICRLVFSAERPNSITGVLPLTLNDLTWPCFARLALMNCLCREFSLSETELLCELRGSDSWTPFPRPGSQDYDTWALLRSRARYFMSVGSSHASNLLSLRHDELNRISIKRPLPAASMKIADRWLKSLKMRSPEERKSHDILQEFPAEDVSGFSTHLARVHSNCHLLWHYEVSEHSAWTAGSNEVPDEMKIAHELLEALLAAPEAEALSTPTDASSDIRRGPSHTTDLVQVRAHLLNGGFDGRFLLFIAAVRECLKNALIGGFESAGCDQISSRISAKFESLLRLKDNVWRARLNGLYGVCGICHSKVHIRENFRRCHRCDVFIHEGCRMKAASGFLEQDPQFYCNFCVEHRSGPGSTDGYIGSLLGKWGDRRLNFVDATRRLSTVVGVDSKMETWKEIVYCGVRNLDGSTTNVSAPSNCFLTQNQTVQWNAGWGPLASSLSPKLKSISRAHSPELASSFSSDIMSAIDVLSSGVPHCSEDWLCVFRGLLFALSNSVELCGLMTQLNDSICGNFSHENLPATTLLLRLRPRLPTAKPVASDAVDSNKASLMESLQSREPLYHELHGAKHARCYRENVESAVNLDDLHANESIGARERDISVENFSGTQDRRKQMESRLVMQVIRAAASCIHFDDLKVLRSEGNAEFISDLVSVAAKRGCQSRSERKLKYVDERDLSDKARLAHDESEPPFLTQCGLCGGDFDYLHSNLASYAGWNMQHRSESYVGQQVRECAHEFCGESLSSFQSAGGNRASSRTTQAKLATKSALITRRSPLAGDYAGNIFWQFDAGNTLMIERREASRRNERGNVFSLIFDDVPSLSYLLGNVGVGRVCHALKNAFPEACLVSHSEPDYPLTKQVVVSDVELCLGLMDFQIKDSLVGDFEAVYGAGHYTVGNPVSVRGNRTIWCASILKIIFRFADSKCVYKVEFPSWSNIHRQWLESEYLIAPNQANVLCNSRMHIENKSEKIQSSPGWIFIAGLNASAFLAAPGRYCDGFSAMAMPCILETCGLDCEVRQLQAALLTLEMALPKGSKHEWYPDDSRKRVERLLNATSAVELTELLLQMEDEIHDAWLQPQWHQTRVHLPNRHFLLRQPSIHWGALLVWTLDQAVMYEKLNEQE